MKVLWTRSAKRDRRKAIDFIAEHDLDVASRLDGLFRQSAKRLEDCPPSGRAGAVRDMRESIPRRSHRILHQIRDGFVFILALVHTSRQWTPETI